MRGSFVSEPVIAPVAWPAEPIVIDADAPQPVSAAAKAQTFERAREQADMAGRIVVEFAKQNPGHDLLSGYNPAELVAAICALGAWAEAWLPAEDNETPAALLTFDGVKSSTAENAATAGQYVTGVNGGEQENTTPGVDAQEEVDWYGLPEVPLGYTPDLLLDCRMAGAELERFNPGVPILIGDGTVRFSKSNHDVKALVVSQRDNPHSFAFTFNRSSRTIKTWDVMNGEVTHRLGEHTVGPQITSLHDIKGQVQRHVMSGVAQVHALIRSEDLFKQAVQDYKDSKPTFKK